MDEDLMCVPDQTLWCPPPPVAEQAAHAPPRPQARQSPPARRTAPPQAAAEPFRGMYDAPAGPGAHLTPDQVREARAAAHVPEGGFAVQSRGRSGRIDVNAGTVDEVSDRLNDPRVQAHIEETLRQFENDPRHPVRREDIDLPMVLAQSMREGGGGSALSTGDRRIVSAGRDAHTEGRSGMDHLWNSHERFPESMQGEIERVRDNPDVPGRFLTAAERHGNPNNTEPAYLPQRDMLAAHIVEQIGRREAFTRRFDRAFSDQRGFTDEQREALLAGMSTDTRRAWEQSLFGSQSEALLRETRDRVQRQLRDGRSLDEIAADPEGGMNALITDDTIMPTSRSRQRCRVTAAEARMIEAVMPEGLRQGQAR